MRVRPDEKKFAEFLLTVGNGTANEADDRITLPPECQVITGGLDQELFKDPINRRDWKQLSARAILAPINEQADEWNKKVMEAMPVGKPEEEQIYYSIDEAISEGQHVNVDDYPIEFLHKLNPPSKIFALIFIIFQVFRLTSFI